MGFTQSDMKNLKPDQDQALLCRMVSAYVCSSWSSLLLRVVELTLPHRALRCGTTVRVVEESHRYGLVNQKAAHSISPGQLSPLNLNSSILTVS